MRTNIEIDDQLMKKVMRGSGARTKKAAVEAAMRLYVQLQDQAKIRELRGKV
jgi:Arc/MetJ family transcription regulator